MGFNSVLKVAADFLRARCFRGTGLRDRRGLSFASALSVGYVMRSTPKPSPRRKSDVQLAA